MPGSPRKRARKEAAARGEMVPGASKNVRVPAYRMRPLTEDVLERILNFARAGNFAETAASVAGVERNTFRSWLNEGARDLDAGNETMYSRLVHELQVAQAHSQAAGVARIRSAALDRKVEVVEHDADGKVIKRTVRDELGDWKAEAWRLERMFPSQFAQRIRMEVENELSSVIEDLEAALPEDAYIVVLQVLSKRFGEGGG